MSDSAAANTPLRVLIAPDSFKGTLSAAEAAEAIALGVHEVLPDAAVTLLPFADGGEGTVAAATAAGAQARRTRVPGPLGAPVDAEWAMLGDTAVIEQASASGLMLVDPSPQTALDAHTEGVGALIRAAVDAGAGCIVLGVGGSASTDAGAGALRALGARLLDRDGAPVSGGGGALHRIHTIEASAARSLLGDVELVLCSDVANPFLGDHGAARLFAPQKGADAEAVELLEEGLRTFAAAAHRATGIDLATAGWGGSGGGIAGGLQALLGAEARDGVEVVAELLCLDEALRTADLVIVGEGSLDAQSLLGKTPVGIARHAQQLGVPCLAVAGVVSASPQQLRAVGIDRAIATVDLAPDPATARRDAATWVRAASARLLVEYRS